MFTVSPSPADAVSGNDFQAGNIISDSNFYAGSNMSAAEIQTFLEQQVPRCTLGDAGKEPGSPWGTGKLAQKCLRDYVTTTTSKAPNAYCAAYPGAHQETAAQIIAKVGKACNISPKVLLVLLEKEQSLVRDSWPSERQFNLAMGYNCPDSGPNNSANCNSRDSGFFQQVYLSAWQFQVYKAHPNNYRYRAHANNSIQWNPNPGCGASNVYIENSATAALYIYTPYQPNRAALDAGWGLGDSCSAYGNRNFFLLYNEWFGQTTAPAHAHVDSVTGAYGGIEVSGWARMLDPSRKTEPAWMWANIYDANGTLVSGSAIQANLTLSWFNTAFPGWGNNHGFNAKINALPGTYTVKIYNSSVNSELVSVSTARVPIGQGHVDSVTSTVGGLRVTGWSVDFRSPATPDSLRIVVNGKETKGPFVANVPVSWIDTLFPGAGENHGFDIVLPVSPGKHQVCVYGAPGLLSPCTTTTFAAEEHGSFDSATPTENGIRITGWALNTGNSAAVDVSYTVNGGKPQSATANTNLNWFNSYWPGAGNKHGFNLVIPVTGSGSTQVCVTVLPGGKNLGCKDIQVRQGSGISFDSVAGTPGMISANGWSAVFGSTTPQYVWINVDGVGRAYKADQPLSWFNNYAPGSGNNHGFAAQIPASPGLHEVCVYDAASGLLAGCKEVTVPVSEQGHLDSVTAVAGGVRLTGWSHVVGQPSPGYIWVDVAGKGSAHKASASLSWFNEMFPGQGNQHGFDVTIPTAPGAQNVCVFSAATGSSLGCSTVTVD